MFIGIYWAKTFILLFSIFNSDIAFIFACTATGWACFGIWVSTLLAVEKSVLLTRKQVFYIEQVALNIGEGTPIQMAA